MINITLKQKEIAYGNKSLYLDIYENGKHKKEFLSLYLLPEIDEQTRERNRKTLEKAWQIRAERILHPESIPAKGHEPVRVDDDGNDMKVTDWIGCCISDMESSGAYSVSIIKLTRYLLSLISEFLKAHHRQGITMHAFNGQWFKLFFQWLKDDYVPGKYVRISSRPLSPSSLHGIQQRLVAIFNKAVRSGVITANPFYKLDKCDIFSKPTPSAGTYLTPDELKLFMSSVEKSPGVADAQRAFGFACLTGLRISDIYALKWSDIYHDGDRHWLTIVQKKTKNLNVVPICPTALSWLPPKRDSDRVFSLPARPNVDTSLKRIAKKVGITKNIHFHVARHTFATLVQTAIGDIETTKALLGHTNVSSTAIYADVVMEDKIKAVENTATAFQSRENRSENTRIPRTKRTAATTTHPRNPAAT